MLANHKYGMIQNRQAACIGKAAFRKHKNAKKKKRRRSQKNPFGKSHKTFLIVWKALLSLAHFVEKMNRLNYYNAVFKTTDPFLSSFHLYSSGLDWLQSLLLHYSRSTSSPH